jgi:hypothetical protein
MPVIHTANIDIQRMLLRCKRRTWSTVDVELKLCVIIGTPTYP